MDVVGATEVLGQKVSSPTHFKRVIKVVHEHIIEFIARDHANQSNYQNTHRRKQLTATPDNDLP